MSELLKIALLGDPQSGKSVFISGLMSAYPNLNYVQACPDGEGPSFWALSSVSEVAAKAHKAAFAKTFDDAFTSSIVTMLESIVSGQWVVDCGGKQSPQNDRIIGACTSAIILYKTLAGRDSWIAYAEKLCLPVMASIHSDLEGSDTANCISGLIRGTSPHVLAAKPAIQALRGILA